MSIKVKPNNIHVHGGLGGNVVYLKLALDQFMTWWVECWQALRTCQFLNEEVSTNYNWNKWQKRTDHLHHIIYQQIDYEGPRYILQRLAWVDILYLALTFQWWHLNFKKIWNPYEFFRCFISTKTPVQNSLSVFVLESSHYTMVILKPEMRGRREAADCRDVNFISIPLSD